MKPFREALMYEPMFPLILKYKEYRVSEDIEPSFHYHDWYEIVYVHSGKGSFFIDRSFYDMEAGDLFAIPGNTIHRARTNSRSPYVVTVLQFHVSLIRASAIDSGFSYLESFEQNKRTESYKINLQNSVKLAIETHLEKLSGEAETGKRGYRHQILATLQSMLTDMGRMREQAQTTADLQSKTNTWMEDILAYIELHFSEQLTLDHLAGQALVSTAHFSREFYKMTGFHLPLYLNIKRIMKAKELLLQNKLPVSTISEQCGFRSAAHFYRVFKAYFGLTPNHWRKNYGEK